MERKEKIKFNIIVIIAIILLSIATIPKTFQEDTFYMIKIGEYICKNGMKVIEEQIEPFAWHEGLIYTYPHWLFDIIIYLIYSFFNVFGIYIFTVIMGIIIYLLIYYTNVKVGKNNVISALITIAIIYLFINYITARSQIITYLCCILTILFIERFLETGNKRYFFGLFIIPIIIANCHAALFPIYFIIFLPYIAEYLISFLNKKNMLLISIKRINKKILKLNNNKKADEQKYKLGKKVLEYKGKINEIELKNKLKEKKLIIQRNNKTKWLILVFIICFFTGLLTPIKDIPYTYIIKSIQGNTMLFIQEHQPVVLINSISILLIYVVISILIFSNKIKINLADLLMLIGMSILGLISYKQLPIFIICTMCIINKLTYMIISDNIKEKTKKILKKILSLKYIIYIVLIIMIIFLVQYKNIASQSYIDSTEYPVLASSWLKNNVNTQKMKLFNDFDYGSYLLFKDIQVFIDGRADVYDPVFNGKGEDIFIDYIYTASLKVWYEDIFRKYEITHIITPTDSELNTFLQRNISYKNIYNDGAFSIYENLTK